MKDYLKNIVSGTSNKLLARGKAVEYYQEKILQILQEKGAFQHWIFHGGTALRFLYAPRQIQRTSSQQETELVVPGY